MISEAFTYRTILFGNGPIPGKEEADKSKTYILVTVWKNGCCVPKIEHIFSLPSCSFFTSKAYARSFAEENHTVLYETLRYVDGSGWGFSEHSEETGYIIKE